SRTSTVWVTTAFKQGDSHEVIGKIKLAGHPVLEKIFEGWKMQQEYYPVLSGGDLEEYYKFMKPHLSFPHPPDSITQYGSYFYFKEGLVFAWTEKELSEEEKRIFRRFTAVISLTYRRYMELQKSEAAAKDAVRQASLDRIRAEIASMRTTKDLDRITPLIWKELTILGIPFIRCGVFIMDDAQQLIHTFLSTPDGKAIAAFHLPYSTPGKISQVLQHWQSKKLYTDHWDEKAFKEFADILVEQGALKSSKQYLSTLPEGGFFLYFIPFLQGMLYVGNTTQLGEEEIELVQSVTDAFSTAYARYEDFNKLEAAKLQVDKTLSELETTQAQLIQSEKMASLGELTAGIAHEIQNPMNFVNNFSEVNKELLVEMAEEIEKGNYDAAKLLAKHVEENQEKINHHGKRADAIVKGMLHHSRSSSGIKEPTNINALADEYLRLAYHGLRAKDRSFNATLKSDFDKSLGLINIVPQDIGRVILNLITNAFYAISEKKKQLGEGYEPVVSVSTTKRNDKILLSVKDNGMGISQKVLDKIFQPFFSTKPTGQGTGLGLSISYDIIKAHGGELKVETKEGEGSEFMILLPILQVQ
ncbi:MAG TPA: ATP-binding protein, partial [Chitinophagaceae bacterium]|nr:ATP-binding protein [Chitinophagaceae bacterium]